MSAGEIGRAEFMKSVFGNKDRMDVWGTVYRFPIEPPIKFHKDDIREMCGLLPSAVHRQVGVLHTLGAIQEIDEPQSWGRLFVRIESPVWIVVAAAIEATRDMP